MKIAGISFDISIFPPTKEDWFDAITKNVFQLIKDGNDIIVFPELFLLALSKYSKSLSINDQLHFSYDCVWREFLPKLLQKLKGSNHFIIFGSGPYLDRVGKKEVFYNRSPIIINGNIEYFDKIYLSPNESYFTGGNLIKIFNYSGVNIVPLLSFDLEQPAISLLLKDKLVDLILVPAATKNRNTSQRVLRAASCRSNELGCSILVVPLLGQSNFNEQIKHNEGRQGLFLPALDCIKSTQEDYTEYKFKNTEIKSYKLDIMSLKKVKEKDAEAKSFYMIDPAINVTLKKL